MHDAELARFALDGLRRYQCAALAPPARERPVVKAVAGASLRDCGGTGSALVLVPSLINPPTILDLDRDRSLADVLSRRRRVLLLDWGPADKRSTLDLDSHITERLLPLIAGLGPVTLVGYCLGGTLALATAALEPSVEAVVTLAAPYRFDAYPPDAAERLVTHWAANRTAAIGFGLLPMEVLQAAFWQIDPLRIVAKFARFAAADPTSAEAGRFVALEHWANGGEPLPLPAASQLVEQLFARGGTLSRLPACPMLHVTAAADRIVPAATAAPDGALVSSPSGHVGMIISRNAPEHLHRPLLSWLDAQGPRR